MILSVFVSLCDGCKPSEQRVSLDPRCNFFTQCYKGCSANSMASSHPFPELTGVPQSHSHFVNVIFNFGNILFMCFTHTTFKTGPLSVCCLLFSSHCPAFRSGPLSVCCLLFSSHCLAFRSGHSSGSFPLLLFQATSWHPSGSQGCPSEVLSIGVSTPRFSPCLSICCILMFPGLVFCPMPALM